MFKQALPMVLLSLLTAHVAAAQVFTSFEAGDEGWLIQDVDCYSGYTIQHTTVPVTWHAADGHPGAHVTHHDVTTYCSFFSAPAAYLGNKTAYLGGDLEFSLYTTESDWTDEDVVVLIGAGLVVCHELPVWPPAPPDWQHYVVPLTAAEFTYDDENGATVSMFDFDAVLSDLQVLLLPAEFGAEIEETDGLDSVLLRLPGTPVEDGSVVAARLLGARPNPFNPATTIVYDLPRSLPVRLTVHDAAGRLVCTLRDGQPGVAGRNTAAWHGRDDHGRPQPSGVYFCRLQAAEHSKTIRMMLAK